jgi:hypothetical protein
MSRYPGELAQVCKPVDNAADARRTGGSIRTRRDDNQTVEIIDNGPDPGRSFASLSRFLHEGRVGQGPRPHHQPGDRGDHGGEIEIESKPGETRFIVRRPSTTERNDAAERLQPCRFRSAERFEEIEPATSRPRRRRKGLSPLFSRSCRHAGCRRNVDGNGAIQTGDTVIR